MKVGTITFEKDLSNHKYFTTKDAIFIQCVETPVGIKQYYIYSIENYPEID